jgi:hypothetical protein
MDIDLLFSVIAIGRGILPCVVAVSLIHFLPWPKHGFWRSVIGIAIGWAFMVFYTIVAYNPSGIAMATAQGVDSPAMRYDNNTVAVIIIVGWIPPALAAAAYFAIRWVLRQRREVN